MDIHLANPRGFCAGVERAIRIVRRHDTGNRADSPLPVSAVRLFFNRWSEGAISPSVTVFFLSLI